MSNKKHHVAPRNGAVANVTAEGAAIGESTPATALKTVHRQAVRRASGRRWSWTKQKREALKLVLQGSTMTEAARRVGVHRHTVENWAKRPEWQAELRGAIEEAQLTTKLRRLKTTSVLTDRLGAHSLRALQAEDLDTKQAGLVLREHLNYVKAERELYGEGGGRQPHGPATVLQINLGTPGHPQPVDPSREAEAVARFKEFMSHYDPELAVVTIRPDEADALLKGRAMPEERRERFDHVSEP